jgi:hypothetical protein
MVHIVPHPPRPQPIARCNDNKDDRAQLDLHGQRRLNGIARESLSPARVNQKKPAGEPIRDPTERPQAGRHTRHRGGDSEPLAFRVQ